MEVLAHPMEVPAHSLEVLAHSLEVLAHQMEVKNPPKCSKTLFFDEKWKKYKFLRISSELTFELVERTQKLARERIYFYCCLLIFFTETFPSLSLNLMK